MTDSCGNCYLNIQQENSICCDGCNLWFHLKCSKLTSTKFKALVNKPTLKWHCLTCLTCKHCSKIIKGKSICCDICDRWYHATCAGITKQFDTLSKTGQDWYCRACKKDTFPFHELDNHKVHNMFNSTQTQNQTHNLVVDNHTTNLPFSFISNDDLTFLSFNSNTKITNDSIQIDLNTKMAALKLNKPNPDK